ncbi:MAG: hypothetical protein AB1758_04585 [Candidatus Eremiobacterota bacterium]
MGVYEVDPGPLDLQPADVVYLTRNGERLGKATVLRAGSGSAVVSLSGVYEVRPGDSVEFGYRKQSVGASNTSVLAAARALEGQQIGRGECSDLTERVLKDAGVRLGDPVDLSQALPGDVIHFEAAKGDEWYTGPDHWAVIEQVSGSSFLVLHQNWNHEKKVVRTWLKLSPLKAGKLTVHRPR